MSEGWYAGPGAVQAHRQKEMTIWEPLPQPYDNTSTYASHYQKWPVQMRQKAKAPQGQRPLSAQKFDTRSTMQDAYQHHRAIVQPKSCRPQSAYTPSDWIQPISTTHREAYQKWNSVKRNPFKPASQRDAPNETATGRSTMQDAYQPARNFVSKRGANTTAIAPCRGTTADTAPRMLAHPFAASLACSGQDHLRAAHREEARVDSL